MSNYRFQDYRLKPVQAIQYDGTLAMAAWLANQNHEFTLYSNDEEFSLHLRGQEVEDGAYLRKERDGRLFFTDDIETLYEPVRAPKTLSDLLSAGATVYRHNEPVTGM